MNENKQNYAQLVLAFFAGVVFCYSCCSIRESGEIRQIRQQYESAAKQCAELSGQLEASRRRVENLEAAIDRSKEGITRAEERVDYVAGGMRSDEAIIRECQRIIEELRKDYEGKVK